MPSAETLAEIFVKEKCNQYDFSKSPDLITFQASATAAAATVFAGKELARWQEAQHMLLRWTKDRQIFSQEYVKYAYTIYDNFFRERGFLKGNVLDIGGGWGLYRQWWEPAADSRFIVHDPGVERFLQGAHELHHLLYTRAFQQPMTFVEGFGEELPYQCETFDTCLIASALDHCVDPAKVFAGVLRCLKPNGVLLVLQQCITPQSQSKPPRRSLVQRLTRLISRPDHLFAILRSRLLYQEPHLHHFTVEEITARLKQSGFTAVDVSFVANSGRIYAFTAHKGLGANA